MKYPDISKAVEQEILASYDKLYRLAFSYVKNEQDRTLWTLCRRAYTKP